MTKRRGERKFLLFIFLYKLSPLSGKRNGKQRQTSPETQEFSLLEDPIVHIPSAAAGDSLTAFTLKPDDTGMETAFIRSLLVALPVIPEYFNNDAAAGSG